MSKGLPTEQHQLVAKHEPKWGRTVENMTDMHITTDKTDTAEGAEATQKQQLRLKKISRFRKELYGAMKTKVHSTAEAAHGALFQKVVAQTLIDIFVVELVDANTDMKDFHF